MATSAALNDIKSALQSVFTTANTATASPIDLSSGLAGGARIQEILKINPEMLVPQASMFPLVTCYVAEKNIIRDDIAKDQLNVKRRARVTVNVVGSLWNDNIQSVDEDPADEDINQLMENIELILRGNYNLNGKVNWQRPTNIRYYTTVLDEQAHLRSGVMTLDCEVFY